MASLSDSAGAGGSGGGVRAGAELMVPQFLLKALHAILAVRSPRPHAHAHAPQAAFRRRDRWFHLPLHAPPPPPAAEHLPKPSPGEPLVVDVYLAPSGGGPEEVLERWTVACEPWPSPAAAAAVGEWLAANIAYKRSITLLRALYAALRFLPAYRAFRTLCASGQVYNYEMGHRVGSFATPFSRAEEAARCTKRLAPVETQLGCLVVSVQYLPSLAAFTPLASAAVITDYVGSLAAEAEPIRGGSSWSYRQRQEIGSNVSSSSVTIASRLSTANASSGSRFSMEGWNGGRGSPWTWSGYRQETVGSNVSSSGTIASRLSTANASSGSRFSTFSMEAMAMHFDSLGIHGDVNGNNMDDWEEGDEEETEEEEMGEERVTSLRILVQEFFSAPSANCSIKHGDMSVVERWLGELGVGWVLNRGDGASAGEELNRDAWSWIRALGQITETFCLVRPLFPDRDSMGLPSFCQLKGKHVGERCVPDRYHLALFIQETMLKILSFVDVLVAWDLNTRREEFLSMDRDMPPVYSKLFNQLGVHDALSAASCIFSTQLHWASKTQLDCTSIKIENETVVLLSSYKSKLGKAIRYTTEKIRKILLEDGDASWSSLNPQGSSDIHKVTKSVMTYVSFLWANYKLVDVGISVKDVPHIEYENEPYLNTMIKEMVFCLQKKLAYISESFSDQALGFLFLLNNLYFIQESKYLPVPLVDLSSQIKGHMDKYLAVSWIPLMLILSNPTPLRLVKNYSRSRLSKFESEFQKIYTTQKEWKIPDPELRRRLREVITNKVIPGHMEYIKDNKVTDPKFSQLELESMLQELLEG